MLGTQNANDMAEPSEARNVMNEKVDKRMREREREYLIGISIEPLEFR